MQDFFYKLLKGGSYSLPFLVKLYDKAKTFEMRYINDTSDITYNSEVYKAGTFKYTPNAFIHGFDGGGNFEIACSEYVIDLIESSKEIYLDVVGVLLENGAVQEIKSYHHHYGTASVKDMKLTIDFEADPRLQMTFPSLLWTVTNNKGNA